MAAISFYQAMLSSVLAPVFTGAYDAIPNIRVAYGLRRMRSAYTGAIIRIARISDNLETDIGYLPNGDLDVDSITAFTVSTSHKVVRWYDQSGSGFNANIVNAIATVNGANSRPILNVNDLTLTGGSEDHGFVIPVSACNMVSGSARVQTVYRQTDRTASGNLTNGGAWRITAAGTNLRSHHSWSDGVMYDTFMTDNRYSAVFGGTKVRNLSTLSLRAAGNSHNYWMNGVNFANEATGNTITTGVSQAYFPDCAYGGMDVSELVLFSQGGTNAEQAAVDSLQRSYYNI